MASTLGTPALEVPLAFQGPRSSTRENAALAFLPVFSHSGTSRDLRGCSLAGAKEKPASHFLPPKETGRHLARRNRAGAHQL